MDTLVVNIGVRGTEYSTDNIPDFAIPASQFPTIEIKYKKAKERYDKL